MQRTPNWSAQVFLSLVPASVGCLLGSLVLDPFLAERGFAVTALTVALVLALAGAVLPISEHP